MPTPALQDQVEAFAASGVPRVEICKFVTNPDTGRAFDGKTLRKHFATETRQGTTKANAKVGSTLFRPS